MAAGRVLAILLTLASILTLRAGPARAAAPDSQPIEWSDAGGFRVSLRVRLASTSWGRRSALGLLSLTVPLERFVQPAPRPDAAAVSPLALGTRSSPAKASLAEPPAPAETETATDSAPAATEVASVARPEQQRDKLAILLTPDLARETVRVALRAAGFGAGRERLSSFSTRARSSAALPELRLRGGRSTDESLRLTPTDSDPYRYTQAGGAELFFEVRLTWKLDRLVFSTAELRVEQLRRQRAQAKARLVERVLKVLFAWQRARTKLADATLLPEERAMVILEELEAEALLDVYTAGWFTRRPWPRAPAGEQ